MAKHHVETTINGEPVEYLCETSQTLLDVLRDELGLTGTKEGCTTGDCGACSVVFEGRLVPACLVLAAEVEGKQVKTVEGVARGSKLHPVQKQFLEHGALQCGVCTPGFIVAEILGAIIAGRSGEDALAALTHVDTLHATLGSHVQSISAKRSS